MQVQPPARRALRSWLYAAFVLSLPMSLWMGSAVSRAEESPLARAVQALGGADRLAAFDEWKVAGEGRENLSAELQGREPDVPTWRPHVESVAVDRRRGSVAWERRTPRNDESLRWRRFIYTPDSMGVVDWTAGLGR